MSIDQSVLDKFEAVVESQRKRIMDMKAQDDFIDYSKLDKLIIGVCGGDGIGPMITKAWHSTRWRFCWQTR